MEFIETHCHLNDEAFDKDRGAVIEKSFSAGVLKLVEIACSPAEWAAGEKLAASMPGSLRCAFGVHPEYAKDFSQAAGLELKVFLQKDCAVAVGEMGLDYWWEPARRKEQHALLETQLPLCAEFSKPAVFHARNGKKVSGENAYMDLLACLRRDWGYAPGGRRFRGVLHCFSGEWEDAKSGLDLGLALGVNGTFTYKKNGELRETIRRAGLENIVLETDCPYLPPQSARGLRNDPSYIPETASAVAEYFGVAVGKAADVTTANALEIFGVL